MKADREALIKRIIKEVVMAVQVHTEMVEAVVVVLSRDVAALTRKGVVAGALEAISTMATKDPVVAASGETLTTIRLHSLMEDVVGTREVVDHVRATHQAATLHPTHLSQAVVPIRFTKVRRSTTMSPTPSTRSLVEPTEFAESVEYANWRGRWFLPVTTSSYGGSSSQVKICLPFLF